MGIRVQGVHASGIPKMGIGIGIGIGIGDK